VGLNPRTTRFAEEIGPNGAVWIRGTGSRVSAPTGVRTVAAPAGIDSFQPDEMTVSCGAGTSLLELDESLREHGQYVNLGQHRHSSGTVGGALATGWNDHLRLGRGHVRESLLEAHIVDGRGDVVKGGGPTVKNVSGFDLCRLLVGSHGRLGALAAVTLRTRPLPAATRWFRVEDVSASGITDLITRFHRPSSVLWDARSAWVCLEGHPSDIDATMADLAGSGHVTEEVEQVPSPYRFAHRWSVAPGRVFDHVSVRAGRVLAEVGIGVIHTDETPPDPVVDPVILEIHRRLWTSFDPDRRLNPGAGDVPFVTAR
jgi:FAD/FMN-containing dehydrogenase